MPCTGGGGELYKLDFLHFKFCTKILYTICSVFLRICAGSNSKRPLFLMSTYWEPDIIFSLIFQRWHRFCRARICRVIFSPTRSIPPSPPPGSLLACSIVCCGRTHRGLDSGRCTPTLPPLLPPRSPVQVAATSALSLRSLAFNHR